MKSILLKSIARYIDRIYDIKNLDILFNDRIECIGDCTSYKYDLVINAEKYLALPSTIDHYIYLYDYIDRLGLEQCNLTISDYSRIIEAICIEKVVNGISGLFIDLGETPYVHELPGVCRSVDVVLGLHIDQYMERGRSNRFVPVISEDNDPFSLQKLLKEIDEEIIYIRFLMERKHPYIFKEKTGYWPIVFLEKNNVFKSGKIYCFIGMNWISSMDLEILRHYRDRVLVIVLPTKTMYIGNGGFTPVYELLSSYGIRVYLGTSGLNDSLFDEAKQLYLLYKYNYWDNRLTIDLVKSIVFQGGHTLFKDHVLERGYPTHITLYNVGLPSNPFKLLLFNKIYPEYMFTRGVMVYDRDGRRELMLRYSDLLVKLIG